MWASGDPRFEPQMSEREHGAAYLGGGNGPGRVVPLRAWGQMLYNL